MMPVSINKSPMLNQTDTVSINGTEIQLNIDSINDTDRDLILLYMYVLPKFQSHGIKVGMKKCKVGTKFWDAIKSRVKEQQNELALTPEQYKKYGDQREIIHWGICLDAKDESFKDYYVHDKILNKKAGLTEKEQEWFINVPADELIEVFEECRHEGGSKTILTPRKEQRECVDALKTYFAKHPVEGRFLLNCKMRFGKSYTTYKFCEEANLNKVLILTFVPAVQSSWRDDLYHIEKDYRYCTDDDLRRDTFKPDTLQSPFVMFLSLQNYLGKMRNSTETKERIKKLSSVDWDLVVLDEYHFGAWNRRTQSTIDVKNEYEEMDEEYLRDLRGDIIRKFSIHTARTICLSGTPFRSLAINEFDQDAIYSYTYFDEQRNKYPNSEENDFSVVDPQYAEFPDMKVFGYNMGKLFDMGDELYKHNKELRRSFFSLDKFFEVRNDSGTYKFLYEDEVKTWIQIIKGLSPTNGQDFPYSQKEMLDNSVHTLWLMPSRNSTSAMADLLREDDFFGRYQIIDLSAPGVGVGQDAYDYLMKNINESKNTNKLGSIALTVNKLTLGVTIKPWSAVFVLKDLTSPENYFQAIFRIQTPYTSDGVQKKQGFVYDFNIDRAVTLMFEFAKKSTELEDGKATTKLKIARMIIKYLPIFLDGNIHHPISEEIFYQLASFGDTAGTPLSKKISDTRLTTRIGDDETLACMMNDPEVKPIFEKVFAHAKFSKNKSSTPIPPPPDDFDPEIERMGKNAGYKAGLEDFPLYVHLDDAAFEKLFLEQQKKRAEESMPAELTTKAKKAKYYNAFVRGYQSGVNVPVQKLKCGEDDGKKFVAEIRQKFGQDIQWTKETAASIKTFINKHLNNMDNIPKEYRGALYRIWYAKSFINAIKKELTPRKLKVPGETVEDADNVLRHILSRLFEFLYISVYRETTFDEIFANADADIFLEAVGITKEEFQILNKYHIFEENMLNNCIHDFFVNESLGSRLNMESEEVRKRYRNSFDWFGFGLESDN